MNGEGESIVRLKRGTLKRVLGVFDLFAVGYGDLGSSIYYALGVTALFALGATPIALLLAGLVFVCTALSYAEMTSMFHESGGSASFARYAFNDLISFIAGWGLLLDYIVTIAISAFAVAPYLSYFFADLKDSPVQIVFSVVLILALLFTNIVGVKHSTRISAFLSIFTLIVQGLIIAIGIGTILNITQIWDHLQINLPNVSWSPTWPQFIKGVAMAMVAYTGIESIAQLASESHRPSKTVPKAIISVMVVLVVVYLGISVVALSAVSAYDLGTKFMLDPVAAIVAALPFGKEVLAPTVALLAAFVLTAAANAGLLGASRLTFNMGEHYQLPRFFYIMHPRFKTPIAALIAFALFASFVVIVSLGKLEFMADLYNFGAMLAFLSTHLSVIVLRIKKPQQHRSFKIPLNLRWGPYRIPLTAIVGALATFAVWCLVVIEKPYGRYLGFAWMTFGLFMYFYYRKKRQIKAIGSVKIQDIHVPDFKPFSVKNILLPTRIGMQTETIQLACDMAKLHSGKLTALYVIEISPSLPLDVHLSHRMAVAKVMLDRVDAIAGEMGIEVHKELIRSRSTLDAIVDTAQREHHDLIILGMLQKARDQGIVPFDALLRKSPCRIWLCS